MTCDIEGSIQFLKQYTSPDEPVFYYDPITETQQNNFEDGKKLIMYMAIDFLPS